MASSPPVRVSDAPAQTGPLLLAVGVGNAFTAIVVVAVLVHPLPSVTCKIYAPPIAVTAEEIVGLCNALVKLFGPVQA